MPQKVPNGPFDGRSIFGQDAVLLHSSGEMVQVNDSGILFRALRDGESYLLVKTSRAPPLACNWDED